MCFNVKVKKEILKHLINEYNMNNGRQRASLFSILLLFKGGDAYGYNSDIRG